MPPESVAQVDAVLRINEDVLRYLIVRSEEVGGAE
jgi:ribosomal protein S6